MRGQLFNNPFFASGIGDLVDTFLGGNPQQAAAAELYAAQAANENDTRRYRAEIGQDPDDLTGILLKSLQAGGDFGRAAPGIVSSIGSLPGSGLTPEQMAQLQVGTGTQTASGTFVGQGRALQNNLDQVGLQTASRERIAADDRDAETARMQDAYEIYGDLLKGSSSPAVTALERLQQTAGPLKITSAYRSPEHNAKVGGAKGSQHLHGNAFDIDTSGMDDATRAKLIMQAREAGFGGIGVYDDSLHFDVGGERAWGPDYHSGSVPQFASDALRTGTGGGDESIGDLITSSLIPGETPDPDRALELLLGAGIPGMSGTQAGILKSIAGDFLDPSGADDESYRIIPPEEAKQRGLPPGQWQEGPNGQLSRLAGSEPDAPGATYRILSAAEAQQRGLPPGQWQENTSSKQITRLAGSEPSDPNIVGLSAGGRTALFNALGDSVPDMEKALVAASIDDLIAGGMGENEALAYALDPANQERGPGTDAVDTWMPFDAQEAVPGPLTGLKQPAGAVDPVVALQDARAAIAKGANREAVIQRLKEMGIDTSGL